jgi:hypothetical protein
MRLKHVTNKCRTSVKNRGINDVLVDTAEAMEEVATLHLLQFQMAALIHQFDWLVH